MIFGRGECKISTFIEGTRKKTGKVVTFTVTLVPGSTELCTGLKKKQRVQQGGKRRRDGVIQQSDILQVLKTYALEVTKIYRMCK